jgi:hypothetical protein
LRRIDFAPLFSKESLGRKRVIEQKNLQLPSRFKELRLMGFAMFLMMQLFPTFLFIVCNIFFHFSWLVSE